MSESTEVRDPDQIGPRTVVGRCVERSGEEGSAGVLIDDDGQRWACEQIWQDQEHGDGGSGCWRLVPGLEDE